MTELADVLDRLGGRRGLIDGAVPPLLFAATNAGAGALGQADRALPLALTAAAASALALGVLRRLQGKTVAGVLRGLVVLVVAAGFALWTGQARDFFLPGLYVDAAYAVALAGSVLVGRPLIGYAYATLFRDGGRWRHDPRLRRALGIATLGWAATYAVRAGAQLVLYRADEPGLLAVAKLALGWPLTAVAVVLTLRAVRRPGDLPGASERDGKPLSRPRQTPTSESETVMGTDTHQPRTVRAEASAAAPRGSGPVTRIVAGSLAAGTALAAVLTLVVFAGGTESVVTGSALTGFGVGWALLATLTARYTSRPQRWAFVPAAAMGGIGLALLASTPENAGMTRLAWVWPPVMLALAVWMFLRMRRSLPRGGRVLLTPVVAALAIVSIGATYENIGLTRDQDAYPAPGKLYDVAGHRLHLDCHGHGGPTVVLFNGLGEISASWARIADPVAESTRVCAYDRAGQGWSTDAQRPQDGVEAARELHALLAAAGETGPFVLAGHSIGGPYAMTYAARYPGQVAGLVLLDGSSPEQYTRVPGYAGQYALMRRGLALMPALDRVGLGRLLPASPLPAPAAEQVKALTQTARGASNGRDELSVLLDTFTQAQALTTLDDRPVAVLTASENVSKPGWSAAQEQMAALSTNHVHRAVSASHMGLLEDPAPAAASARAITAVVDAVRTGAPVDPR